MTSDTIQQTLSAFDQAQKDHKWAHDQVGLLDKETQDILHGLEFDPITKNDRNRLATRLQRVRRERRKYKDIVQCNDPLVTFLQSDKGKNMVNLLKEALGKTRKVEDIQEIRTYKQKAIGGQTA